jgi:hypothetical protein
MDIRPKLETWLRAKKVEYLAACGTAGGTKKGFLEAVERALRADPGLRRSLFKAGGRSIPKHPSRRRPLGHD